MLSTYCAFFKILSDFCPKEKLCANLYDFHIQQDYLNPSNPTTLLSGYFALLKTDPYRRSKGPILEVFRPLR